MTRVSGINPEVLVWARESGGLSMDDAAQAVGLTSSAKSSAVEKLAALERGDRDPTQRQLLAMAKAYRRPLAILYLQEPPTESVSGEDFRSSNQQAPSRDNDLLKALLRDIRSRHLLARALVEGDGDRPLAFVGSADPGDGVAHIADAIAAELQFDPMAPTVRRGGTDALFRRLRERAEALGMFVLLVGDLGSHHTDISADTFRGYAIADPVAPIVVINDNDARSAWSFTLMHELAHIWLGSSGVSGPPSANGKRTGPRSVERLCNDVASELLLPREALESTLREWTSHPESSLLDLLISEISGTWAVSTGMVAYRLFRVGAMDALEYERRATEMRARYRLQRDAERERRRAEGEDRPISHYVVKRHRLGTAYLGLVRRSLRERSLTYAKAAQMLGVQPASVETLLSSPSAGGASPRPIGA